MRVGPARSTPVEANEVRDSFVGIVPLSPRRLKMRGTTKSLSTEVFRLRANFRMRRAPGRFGDMRNCVSRGSVIHMESRIYGIKRDQMKESTHLNAFGLGNPPPGIVFIRVFSLVLLFICLSIGKSSHNFLLSCFHMTITDPAVDYILTLYRNRMLQFQRFLNHVNEANMELEERAKAFHLEQQHKNHIANLMMNNAKSSLVPGVALSDSVSVVYNAKQGGTKDNVASSSSSHSSDDLGNSTRSQKSNDESSNKKSTDASAKSMNTGRWSANEHKRFLAGLDQFG